MSEVDRWNPDGYGDMYDYQGGRYVLFTDYEALRARLAEAERLLYVAARHVLPAVLSCNELTAMTLDEELEVEKPLLAEIDRLRAALTSVVKHWREFGPEHGFDETLERAALAGGAEPKHAPHCSSIPDASGPAQQCDCGAKP